MGSGVPVANKLLVSAAYAVSCVALLGLTGCGGSAPDDGYGGPGPSAPLPNRVDLADLPAGPDISMRDPIATGAPAPSR